MTNKRLGDYRPTPSAVIVSTSDYEFAHGRRPSGNGHWAFFFERNADVSTAFWHSGKYGDAKRVAQREAERRGISRIYVGS